jgi:hypothetical protein
MDTQPIYVRWIKGRKSGKTKVQWEDNNKITFPEDAGVISFNLTLFWDEKKKAYEPKPVLLSIERYMRDKKAQRMGAITMDLTEYADVEKPLENKKLRLEIEDGALFLHSAIYFVRGQTLVVK